MFFLRRLRLNHLIFLSLLWCAVAFVYSGVAFSFFDDTSVYFQKTRYHVLLNDLKQQIQTRIDKGTSLTKIKNTDSLLLRYLLNDTDVLSIFLVDLKTNQIAFSSLREQKGLLFDKDFSQKCAQVETPLEEKQKEKSFFFVSVTDSAHFPTGCLVLEYVPKESEKIRSLAQDTAFRHALFLASSGIFSLIFIMGIVFFIRRRKNFISSLQKKLFILPVFFIFAGTVYFINLHMYQQMNVLLINKMTLKTKTLSSIMRYQLEKTLKAGIPLRYLNGTESFLSAIGKEHLEIAFILITDEAGRVLYSIGQPSKAFTTNKKNGTVSLKKGYFKTAEPLHDEKGTKGWIQIGIKKDHVQKPL